MQAIFDAFEKLISDFSFKRIFFWTFTIFIIGNTLYQYENYTKQFELNKIEKSILLLDKLQKYQINHTTKQDTELDSIYTNLKRNLLNISQESESDLSKIINIIPLWLKKFLITLLPWLFLTMFLIGQEGNAIKGALFFGLIMATIGAFIPNIMNLDFNFFYYPIGHFILIIIILLLIQRAKKRRNIT